MQRKASNWTLNNYDYYSSVAAMLQDLDWPTLQYRLPYFTISPAELRRLSLFYKSLNNLMALEIPPHYIPNNHQSRLRTSSIIYA